MREVSEMTWRETQGWVRDLIFWFTLELKKLLSIKKTTQKYHLPYGYAPHFPSLFLSPLSRHSMDVALMYYGREERGRLVVEMRQIERTISSEPEERKLRSMWCRKRERETARLR